MRGERLDLAGARRVLDTERFFRYNSDKEKGEMLTMTTLTIELTDLSTETLTALVMRAAERKAARLEAYVQALIEQDIQGDCTQHLRTLKNIH